MSERAPRSPEHHEHHPKTPEASTQAAAPERAKTKEHSAEDIKNIADTASEKAKKSSEVVSSIHSETAGKKEGSAPSWTTPNLRNHNYANIMRSARKKLSKTNRAFSKVIHINAVEKVSETSGKTIARPSAFLGGALASLVGSLVVLYIARRNGFQVPPMMFVFLFAGGYIAGLALELVFNFSKKLARR